MKYKAQIIIVSTIIALVGAFLVAKNLYKGEEAQKSGFLYKEDFKSFVPDHAIRKGNPEAKVYVVEFFDPECESCRAFYPYI